MVNNLTNPLLFILNKILGDNDGSRERLVKLRGRSFSLSILGIELKGVIDNEGFITTYSANVPADMNIVIPPSASKCIYQHDKIGFLQQLNITGDKKLANEFLEIIANLHFAGIYNTNFLLGRVLDKLLKCLKFVLASSKELLGNISYNITDYLQYQSGDLISKHEANFLYNSIDDLKTHVDNLYKRINLLVR